MQTVRTLEFSDIYFKHAIDMKPDNRDFPMHTHEHYELFTHIRGRGKYMVEGNEYNLEPGCVIVVRPTESHKLYLEPTEPYERIVIEFSSSLFKQIDPEKNLLRAFHERPLGKLNQYFSWEFQNSISNYVSRMTAPGLNAKQRRITVILSMFEILYSVDYIFQNKFSNIPNNTSPNPAADIVEYVNSHLFEDLSLSSLCNTFFISQCQLSRIFKAATGSSIAEYISIKRLFEARRKLKLGEQATDVAKQCGYSDYSAFFRAYKKRFKISPSQEIYTAKQQTGKKI